MSVHSSDGEFEDEEIDEFCVVPLKYGNHWHKAYQNNVSPIENEARLTQANADIKVAEIVLTQPLSSVRWKTVRYESSVFYHDNEGSEQQRELSGSDNISLNSEYGSERQKPARISFESKNIIVANRDLSSESIQHMRLLLESQILQKAAKYSNLIDESEEFEVQELLEGIGQIGLKADAKISGSEFDGQELEDIE